MADCINNCLYENRIETLEREMKENREAHKNIYMRLEGIYESKARMDFALESVQHVVEEIRSDVKVLKERPIRRYEGIVNQILQYIITAILAYIAIRIGLLQ